MKSSKLKNNFSHLDRQNRQRSNKGADTDVDENVGSTVEGGHVEHDEQCH